MEEYHCVSEKSRFIKQQDASGLLCSLGIRIPLSQIPWPGPLVLMASNEWNDKFY